MTNLRRFFIEDITPESREAVIKGAEFIHLKRVLRLRTNDKVSIFNGKGLELSGEISSIDGSSARITIKGVIDNKNESFFKITLIQGLIKGDKPERIIQKAVELGVAELIFFASARSVPDIAAGKDDARLGRWTKVAIGAAKQSKRPLVPDIKLCRNLKLALESAAKGSLKLLLSKDAETQDLRAILRKNTGILAVSAVVGPEGGLTPEEEGIALGLGFAPISLGPRTLRAETAALSIITLLQYELGDAN